MPGIGFRRGTGGSLAGYYQNIVNRQKTEHARAGQQPAVAAFAPQFSIQQALQGIAGMPQRRAEITALADPMAAQRAQYAQQLQQLMTDPAAITRTPSYQFRFGEGQRALESRAVSEGLLGSGRMALELQEYGQKAASQEYEDQLRRLQELAKGSPEAARLYMEASDVSPYGQEIGGALAELTRLASAGAAGVRPATLEHLGRFGGQQATQPLQQLSAFFGGGAPARGRGSRWAGLRSF